MSTHARDRVTAHDLVSVAVMERRDHPRHRHTYMAGVTDGNWPPVQGAKKDSRARLMQGCPFSDRTPL